MRLEVLPQKKSLAFEPGANLLETLLQNEIPISYSCKAGRCGVCRCKVINGKLTENGGSQYRRASQIDSNQLLACQTTLSDNCSIEITDANEIICHPARIIKATVTKLENVTDNIKILGLTLAKPFNFSPGQYATLQFTVDHSRPYSMANLGEENYLEFHLRIVNNGRVGEYVSNHLKVGDKVKVRGPMGTSYLRAKHTGPILCVCSGTGLAPVMSILKGIIAAKMENLVEVHVGARSLKDLYKLEELKELQRRQGNMKIKVALTAENAEKLPETTSAGDIKFYSGSIIDAFQEEERDYDSWNAYLAGAPTMVEAAILYLKRKDMPVDRMFVDAFYPTGA